MKEKKLIKNKNENKNKIIYLWERNPTTLDCGEEAENNNPKENRTTNIQSPAVAADFLLNKVSLLESNCLLSIQDFK